MALETSETENLIKETAKRVFFQLGHVNASTKEIAKEAGVNRALIHYYFRSRDFLFNLVLEEAMRGMTSRIGEILGSDRDLRSKIREFLDSFMEHLIRYPYLETFVVTEMAKNPEKMQELHPKNAEHIKSLLDTQLKSEIAAGTMRDITVNHFLANIMSMCNYPLIGKPVLQTIFGYDEGQYTEFLRERKKAVYTTLFNEEYPDL